MQPGQIGALVIVAGIIGLAIGVAAGFGMYAGKIATTNVLQTSTITETQTMISVQKINVTVTPYCCVDANLTILTPCSTIAAANYPPVQRLQYLIETDPDFIAAEQDQNYVDITNGPGCSTTFNSAGGINSSTINFQFAYTIDTLYTNNCGGVENFTYYLYVNVPLTKTGYNMSAIQITPSNSSEITYSCSTSFVSTQNSTVTITRTTTSS